MVKRYIAMATMFVAAVAFAAQPLLVKPGVYDPDQTGIITSAWVPGVGLPSASSPGDTANHGLILQKNGPTATNAAAYVSITGVAGLSTTNLQLGFDYKTSGHCGAGSPRFNVKTTDDETYYFFGCVYGTHSAIGDGTWTHVSFTGLDSYPALPPDKTVASIAIVADEGTDVSADQGTPGSSILDNIQINEKTVGKPGAGPK